MERSDAALVEAVLQGDRDSFSELVTRHRDVVFHVAYRLSRNRADAEDLAQDAFLRAYDKLRLYRPDFSFRTWVCTICANLTKNRFRKEARRREVEREHWADVETESGAVESCDPRTEKLESAMRQLPETLRLPLVLRHAEGLSYEEVARVLSIGVSAAKMRVARARAALQEWMKG